MAKPPKLTDAQKQRLSILEPALRDAVRMADYQKAKALAGDIQALLRPTGHETRLMRAKNWLFEAAMEAGQLEIAVTGLSGVRQKVSVQTRTHLEATALLAICYLRRQDMDSAEPLIAEVLKRDGNIVSERRRQQFRLRAIQRFEEETALAGLKGDSHERLDPDAIMREAGELIRTKTEDEILAAVGAQVPPEVLRVLLRLHQFASRQLTGADLRQLPPARTLEKKASLGRTVTEATKRVVWRSLCDPSSDVYKLWCTQGIMGMYNTRTLTAALAAALAGIRIGALVLASALAAMILKMGLEIFCEVAKPQSMMIALNDR